MAFLSVGFTFTKVTKVSRFPKRGKGKVFHFDGTREPSLDGAPLLWLDPKKWREEKSRPEPPPVQCHWLQLKVLQTQKLLHTKSRAAISLHGAKLSNCCSMPFYALSPLMAVPIRTGIWKNMEFRRYDPFLLPPSFP